MPVKYLTKYLTGNYNTHLLTFIVEIRNQKIQHNLIYTILNGLYYKSGHSIIKEIYWFQAGELEVTMKDNKNSMQSGDQLSAPQKRNKGVMDKGQQQQQEKHEKQVNFESDSSEQQQSPQILQNRPQPILKHRDEQQWQQLHEGESIQNNPSCQSLQVPRQRYKNVHKHQLESANSLYQKQITRKKLSNQKNKQVNVRGQSAKDSVRQLKKDLKQHRTDLQYKRRLDIIIIVLILFIVVIVVAHYFLRSTPSPTKSPTPNMMRTQAMDIRKTEQEQQYSFVAQLPKEKVSHPTIPFQNKISIQPKTNFTQPVSKQPQNHAIYRAKDSTNHNKYSSYSSTLNLEDLSTDSVYINAPPQIKQIFDEMMQRPSIRRTRPNSIFVPSQKAYFAYRLYQNPKNQRYLKAEYYYYDQKYKIGSYSDQLPLCVVAPGRNIVRGQKFKRFIDSIQNQNYTNYILVYLDDNSDDNSSIEFQNYVKQTNGPLNKYKNSDLQYQGSFIVSPSDFHSTNKANLIIVQNKQRLYALANRNQGVRNFCPSESIVLDVDSDDAIIGKQAFKLVNAVYHDTQVWMFNSVFIYQYLNEVTTGPQDGVPEEILMNNQYRTSMVWKTSQLRTFKAQLFNKINEQDFKDDKGVFYQWASDVFIQEPLVELAGPRHYKHLYEIVYFYDWEFDRTTIYKRRHYRDIVFMQTPYLPLDSLQSQARKVDNYSVPQRIRDEYQKNIIEGRKEATRYGRQAPF